MHEVQILQVPHARRDLGRHVDETVETETKGTAWVKARGGKLFGDGVRLLGGGGGGGRDDRKERESEREREQTKSRWNATGAGYWL